MKFSIQSTGTGPLNYKWEWMPTGEEGGAKQWQPCNAKWCKCPTLTISKVDESNDGSYRCVVSNDAGSDVSNPATLTTCKSPNLSFSYSMNFVLHLLHLFVSAYVHVAKPPRITTHPQKLKDVIPGKSAKLTVQAMGTEPLNYNWQWKRDGKGSGNKEWQPCEEGWSDGATLTIPGVQKPNEGSYRCVVSNHAGT